MISKKVLSFTTAMLFSSVLLAGSGHEHKPAEPVNVNKANTEQLDKGLIGVGEKTAMAIVDYREKNGPFTNTDELMKVNRIGVMVIEKNKERIVFE
ncbi:hypothetical protein ACH42_17615 [Endozoicomonas sp. (ex Bugula neritina AB1)]|nr:hypothetical protein ACH42_17615 [Endozoicomonas sp. (ex Bugula neritina AB1)]